MAVSWNPAVDGDNLRWREQAACQYTDANLFFPTGSTGAAVDQIESAKAACGSCTVTDASLQCALETNQEAGIWGSTDEDERRRLRKVWPKSSPAGETVGDGVRIDVGLVAPAGAVAWMEWADEALEGVW